LRAGRPAHEWNHCLCAAHACADGRALCFSHDRRSYRFCSAEHRSLSRPGSTSGRHRHAESRPVGGGDRALHHHSNRSGFFGLSDVKLQFTYDLTYEEAEQKVLNRLSQLPALQNQAQPTISPWSPIGEIYRYQLVGPPGYSVMDLKTLQDWVIARRFRAVPGVIDVTGWGGKTKTFEIQIDRDKLVAYGLTLPQVLQTLNNSNINVGGNTVNIGQQSAVVRGVGLIRSMSDIRNTMLTAAN